MWLDTTNMVCTFVSEIILCASWRKILFTQDNLAEGKWLLSGKKLLPRGTKLLPSRKIMLLSFISQDYHKKIEQNRNFRKILTF